MDVSRYTRPALKFSYLHKQNSKQQRGGGGWSIWGVGEGVGRFGRGGWSVWGGGGGWGKGKDSALSRAFCMFGLRDDDSMENSRHTALANNSEICVIFSSAQHHDVKRETANNDLLLNQAHGLLAPKVKFPQISNCGCVWVRATRTGGFNHLRTISHCFLLFLPKRVGRIGERGGGWWRKETHSRLTCQVYIKLPWFRFLVTGGKQQQTNKRGKKGVECGGHTFTSGESHLYFRLTKVWEILSFSLMMQSEVLEALGTDVSIVLASCSSVMMLVLTHGPEGLLESKAR